MSKSRKIFKCNLNDLKVSFTYEDTENNLILNFLNNEFPYDAIRKKELDLFLFIEKLNSIKSYFAYHKAKIAIVLDKNLMQLIRNIPDHRDFITVEELSDHIIFKKISSEGFSRELKDFQKRNLRKLCALPACADFSVPGAGKTTDALAFYSFKKTSNTKLMIISPLNAFASWEDELKECFKVPKDLTRLPRGKGNLKKLLSLNPENSIINYECLLAEGNTSLLIRFLLENPDTLMVLDESHKAKGEKTFEKIKTFAPYVKNKIILTGTPMPYSREDLMSQFYFLYPKYIVPFGEHLLETFQPFFQRTSEEELGLKKIKYKLVKVEPYNAQKAFYEEFILKKLKEKLSLEQVLGLKSIESAYLRLLQFISYPSSSSLQEFLFDINPSLQNQIEDEGDGAKMDAVINRTLELIEEKEKVIIWSCFKKNIDTIHARLKSLKIDSEFIYGDVPTSDEEIDLDSDWEKEETREAKIRRFKELKNTMVLIANPAAAAESISLHKVCNYALYLDRNYEARQFLQSEKRIHRLGSDDQKYIEIFQLNVPKCIDMDINSRIELRAKEQNKFLNDPKLREEFFNESKEAYEENLTLTLKDYVATIHSD